APAGDRALEFPGLTGQRARAVAGLSAADRRCVELARAVVGRPRVVLLDEPAAGLPEAETARVGACVRGGPRERETARRRAPLRGIPEQFGALTILVDHDMALVSACCARAVVLDFGRVIASGPTAGVLQDDHVRRAYLGTEEVA